MTSQPVTPYPYDTSWSTVHLSASCANRICGLYPHKQLPHLGEATETLGAGGTLKASRVALLAGGWVRAQVRYESPGLGMFCVDILLAPGEVVAIEQSWSLGAGDSNGPGIRYFEDPVSRHDRDAAYEASWRAS